MVAPMTPYERAVATLQNEPVDELPAYPLVCGLQRRLLPNQPVTYIECRAVLRDYSGDTTTSLGQEFNCYINAIYEFEKKGIDKINGRFKLKLTPNLDR